MRIFAYLLLIIIILPSASFAADWEPYLDSILSDQNADLESALIKKIVQLSPAYSEVISYIENQSYPLPEDTGLIEREALCVDNVTRPWQLYIPPEYSPNKPNPLMIVLHGGASRAEVIAERDSIIMDHPLSALAAELGYIVVFPFAQEKATWWEEVGMANVDNILNTVKSEYNIDPNRIYLGGFSDGASSAFLYAMISPDNFAAFAALNGHMGIGSEDGGLPTYASNFYNRPIYATTTFDDGLYPSHKMRSTIEMAQEAGGDILYREFAGQHDIEDIKFMLPAIFDFFDCHPRNPLPVSIRWESAAARYGRCSYVSIDKVGINKPASWHKEHNTALVDDRVSIGILPADYKSETGIVVGTVVDGETLAHNVGLLKGDIIVRGNGMKINTLADLSEFKRQINRGDQIELTVIRDGAEQVLTGKVPDARNYLLFERKVPSGAIRVNYHANRFDVLTSNVEQFTIYIHPDVINYDQNILINVNGINVYDAKPLVDIEFMLKNYLDKHDKALLFTDKITLEVSQDMETR